MKRLFALTVTLSLAVCAGRLDAYASGDARSCCPAEQGTPAPSLDCCPDSITTSAPVPAFRAQPALLHPSPILLPAGQAASPAAGPGGPPGLPAFAPSAPCRAPPLG